MSQLHFLMAGGGTGGHVMPAIAVARELHARGHAVTFLGTRGGLEARLVPEAGFLIEWVQIGGLNSVGLMRKLRTLWQLPLATGRAWRLMRRLRIAAVFSMGGYVAGPAVAAAVLGRFPLAVMEPNATPGFTNRIAARWVKRALLSFEETARWFPRGRAEITGRPVRAEFFAVPAKEPGVPFTVLITGASQGSRTLNRAARESWPLFAASGARLHLVMQTGPREAESMARDWAAFAKPEGLSGEVAAFISDMPLAFANADLIVCRSGGTVAELAAAGKPGILVPFPFAADDHQTRNAEAMQRAGAAVMVRDSEMTGKRLHREVTNFMEDPHTARRMGEAARRMAKPDATRRAADVLESIAQENA
ncbi:MAG TPA: undecaprenyldiphospho-muramoylpentapeptide beta-N-acetylglucosaminyltransferase [Bryobacteraceae bacterium]|nr:undecaprenyldiphospho-muramoylpentapeptide beta-N-acetylglucosaminyltransferase [Bryobacteraceae bacterium]